MSPSKNLLYHTNFLYFFGHSVKMGERSGKLRANQSEMIQYRAMFEQINHFFDQESNPREIVEQIDLKIRGLISNEPNNPRITALIEYEICDDKTLKAINSLLSDEDHSKLADLVRFNNQHSINSLLAKYTIGNLLPDEYATLQRVIELTDEALEELFANQFFILDQEFQKFLNFLRVKGKKVFINTNSSSLSNVEGGIQAGLDYFNLRNTLKVKRSAGILNIEDVIKIKSFVIGKFLNLLEIAKLIFA